MRPVWLCPLRLREPAGQDGAHSGARAWPSYPLEPGTTYVNVGFWGTVPIAEGHHDGDVNRLIEAEVTEVGGHKSLYSDAYYDEATFDALYNTANLLDVAREVDPDGRLTSLYEKAVRRR
jgi:FAD/FMN-containing dehydrogenase